MWLFGVHITFNAELLKALALQLVRQGHLFLRLLLNAMRDDSQSIRQEEETAIRAKQNVWFVYQQRKTQPYPVKNRKDEKHTKQMETST